MKSSWFLWASALIVSMAPVACGQPLVAPTEPLTAEQQQKKFHLPPGFEIQLVAAEPRIHKPMNLAFDDRGRLLVTHSLEYPFPAKSGVKPRDQVTVLSDFAASGLAGKATTLADGLNIPIGLMPTADGVLVYSIPNIYRFTDADGDGHAEGRTIAYKTFGHHDTNGMTNSFTPWIDGWVYACHGFSNTSTIGGDDGKQIVMNSGNTYRFRADGSHAEQFTHGQVNPFGLCFDPWGNAYTADCHSMPIYQLVRGGFYPSFGKPHDGLGYAPKMLNHNHGSTGIGGVVYYDANEFPKEYHGTMFIGNPVTGRINHDRIEQRGSSPWAIEQPDFVRCDDPWFRPVNIQLGPDGALWIADFYNCIIGHYEVPLDHPRRDRERGRIWRVVYTGKKSLDRRATPPVLTDLTRLSIEKLVERLGDANLLNRVKATNYLIERIGQPSLDAVRKMIARSNHPRQRAHGLWVLERLGPLGAAQTAKLASDKSPLVRVHLVRALAERKQWTDVEFQLVRAQLSDDAATVRRVAADALGLHPAAENIEPLLSLWDKTPSDDTHLIHTIRIALRDHLKAPGAGKQLSETVVDDAKNARRLAEVSLGEQTAASAQFVLRCLRTQKVDRERLPTFVHHVARYLDEKHLDEFLRVVEPFQKSPPHEQAAILLALQRATSERGKNLPAPARQWAVRLSGEFLKSADAASMGKGIELARQLRLESHYPRLAKIANSAKLAALRPAAIDACVATNAVKSVELLELLIARGHETMALRQKAAAALGTIDTDRGRSALARQLVVAPTQLAVTIAASLGTTPSGGKILFTAIRSGKASAALLREQSVVDRLRRAPVIRLDSLIAELTKNLPAGNQRLIKLIAQRRGGFHAATSSPIAGRNVFKKHCASCHSIAGEGAKIGPELDGIGVRGIDRLLEDVLDPSRNVDKTFRATTITTNDGLILSGLVLRTEGQTLVLADSEGKEIRIAISEIDQRKIGNLSPMPENVGDQVSEADFYHLMRFLLSARKQPGGNSGEAP